MNTESIWFLFCPRCSYRQENGVAQSPSCPDCGARLNLDDGTTFQGVPITWSHFDYEGLIKNEPENS